MSIDINDTRALHVPQLVRDGLHNMGRPIATAEVLILGASHREDVGDTRYMAHDLPLTADTRLQGYELHGLKITW